MNLNNILSQLETAGEMEIETLLRDYNREVSRVSACQPKQTAALALASRLKDYASSELAS